MPSIVSPSRSCLPLLASLILTMLGLSLAASGGALSSFAHAQDQRPQLRELPADQDWSVLADSDEPERPLDPVKYIALGESGAYLTLGGQARASHELFVNENYGALPRDRSGSLLLRLMGRADLHLNARWRLYLELGSGLETGRDGGPAPLDENLLDVHQAFVEARLLADGGLFVRAGRQELRYGVGRLVDVRDGPTLRRVFDAVLMRATQKPLTTDIFLAREVLNSPGAFDDSSAGGALLWGGYMRIAPGEFADKGGDVYYLGTQKEDIVYASATGRERRHSIGARIWHRIGRGRSDIEFTYQFGSLRGPPDPDGASNDLGIASWGIAADVAYRVSDNRYAPDIVVGAGWTSGDRNPDDDKLHTYRSPFPDLRFAGATTRLAPGNSYGTNVGLAWSLAKQSRVMVLSRTFWRSSLVDAVYSPAGNPQRVADSDARFIGVGGAAMALWRPTPYTDLSLMAEFFRPGGFLRAAPPAETSLFTSVRVDFRF